MSALAKAVTAKQRARQKKSNNIILMLIGVVWKKMHYIECLHICFVPSDRDNFQCTDMFVYLIVILSHCLLCLVSSDFFTAFFFSLICFFYIFDFTYCLCYNLKSIAIGQNPIVSSLWWRSWSPSLFLSATWFNALTFVSETFKPPEADNIVDWIVRRCLTALKK